jgi:hypothetical protein
MRGQVSPNCRPVRAPEDSTRDLAINGRSDPSVDTRGPPGGNPTVTAIDQQLQLSCNQCEHSNERGTTMRGKARQARWLGKASRYCFSSTTLPTPRTYTGRCFCFFHGC